MFGFMGPFLLPVLYPNYFWASTEFLIPLQGSCGAEFLFTSVDFLFFYPLPSIFIPLQGEGVRFLFLQYAPTINVDFLHSLTHLYTINIGISFPVYLLLNGGKPPDECDILLTDTIPY